jgi:PAS domain S-box-containing protein
VTYVVTILVVALMVYYSRKRTEQTLLKLTAELNTRQRTEKERDRSMQRFARIFRSSPSPMLAQSARDGTILDVNPAFERCYGYTPNQVLGRTDTMLWAQPEQRIGYINTLAAHSRTELARVSALRSDGSHFDVLLSSELGNDPDDRLVITTVTDISSESRRAALLLSVAQGMTGETGEAFFAALARHAAAAFEADLVVVSELLADQRVQTLAVSKDGEPFHNFTYTPQGTPCGETLSRTDLYVHEVGLSTAFPAEQPLTGVHADAYVGQSLRDQDGTAIGVLKAMWRKPISLNAEMRALMSIFSSRATAELMRLRREREIQLLNATLEQRVKLRTAELEKLNAELDSFAYSVSHDLKSPLRSIDGFTRLLAEQLEGRLSPDEAHLFDRVLVSTRRMSTLIADLLALARVSQGQLELESTNLSELAEQVLRAEQMRQPDSPLRWHVEPGLVSRCDPKLVRIALENLLGNAVKYSRNEPSPLVEMGLTHRGGDTLFVRDNGVGFDMAHADKLFKPFQRLHMPNSGFEGTGIGLATVHRIVERHGGRITAESHPGKGAVFYFTLAANALPTMAFDLASA